ncbi:MAG TPA: PBP1A family penicillin-binding protein [Thermoanaerobaculia bacterium]|nr:PBP1A family penicillin-binding protein [Thermoanaerobaculia bacterium]
MAKKRSRVKDFLWRHSAGIAFMVMVLFVAFIGFVGYTYVVITKKFDSSRRWDLPSRIYSDATPIVPGLDLPRALLEPRLNHVGYHEVPERVAQPGDYRYVNGNLEIYLQNFEYPDIEFRAVPVTVGFDGETVRDVRRLDDGVALRGVRIEPELITSIYNNEMEDRLPVALTAVPLVVQNAIIASEDKNFYHHEGISIRGTLGALRTDLKSGNWTHGGSTLTQQLVKNLYLTPERKWSRKITEALMAVLLEIRYQKPQILESYLNEAYFGQNGPVQIVGVEQASRVYFGKHVTYLTLPEAATLSGMIPSPNVLNPLKYPERAKVRRDTVLRLMREQGFIKTDAEYAAAVAAPLTTARFPKTSRSAPFFVDLVLKQLRETYPETQLKTEGLRIFTTLDTIMQRSAEQALDSGIDGLNRKYSYLRKSPTPLEGVMLTIQPGTGYVKALVGGRNYSKTQFNRAIQARRQPGSLFKPFVYATAMDPGRHQDAFTAATVLDDSPISVQTGATVWSPQNYDLRFHGRVTVREALAHSYNIPAVRAAINAGVPNVIKTAATIGIESHLAPYPSVSLGSFEVTPLEIAYAYSAFANLGVKAEPVSILAVSTRDGKLLESREVKMKRVASPGVCYVMNNILQDVFNYGTAVKARGLGFERPYAGKTGTTSNYRDAWFIGFSPRILSLVWVGFDDGHSVRLAGGDACVPIWTQHMNRIAGMVPDVEWKRPDDVVERQIDPESGMLATSYCPQTKSEIFVQGTEPTAVCALHAGSGEPSPFWREPMPQAEMPPSEGTTERPAVTQQQQQQREQQRRDRTIRGILRRIFGGNG